MGMREDLSSVLGRLNAQAWLQLLRWCEGTDGPNGYAMLFGGEVVESLADHPRRLVTRKFGGKGKPITSSAAGAYQFLRGTWDECAKALNSPNFSPLEQDLAALFLTYRRRGLQAVVDGDWSAAIQACNREWASLPGSPYGQPTKTLKQCLDFLRGYTGQLNLPSVEEAPPIPIEELTSKEADMPLPTLAAAALNILLPVLTTKVKEVVTKSTDTTTAEAVSEQIVRAAQTLSGQDDPIEAAMTVRQEAPLQVQLNASLEETIPLLERLIEAGEKSTAAARDFNVETAKAVPFWMLPAFWVTAVLIPLAYIVVDKVLSDDYPPEIKGAVIMAVVVATLSDVRQFWLGSSHSSQAKDLLKR